MKTLLALRHVHFEDLGQLEPMLVELGYRISYVDACTADLRHLDVRSADLMIVLGGPIGAHDDERYPFLSDELELIRQRLASNKPLLGICLGAQLIARALGAGVAPMPQKEIGFSEVHLTLEGGGSALVELVGVPVLHWHGDQFELPQGAQWLAESDVCKHQAFSVGNHVLALQFHLEVDCQGIEQWLVGHAHELACENIDPKKIRRDAQVLGERLRMACSRTLLGWVKRFS
ncbi:glutamine amidotransferase [Pseudomonas sp. TE21394]